MTRLPRPVDAPPIYHNPLLFGKRKTRFCKKCKKEKPMFEFSKVFMSGKWRYFRVCRDCIATAGKKWRDKYYGD